ncbi:MAG TPA: hypothetical protein VMD75_14780 [Candidatus Binataceae bacterium]|nr:hypothetical protein [Candidatus Binataceae bacterium]
MSASLTHSKFGAVPLERADDVQYRECKILLKAELFSKPSSFHKFWKVVHHTAKSLGIAMTKPEKPVSLHLREVVFLDTPKFRLYNNKFILRKRTFYRHGRPEPNFELTLKLRSPERNTVAAVDVRPLLPCVNTVKFKEELLPLRDKLGEFRTIYSHGCELDTPNMILTQRFETICQVFPALMKAGAKAETRLSEVNGIVVDETLANLGLLEFDSKTVAKSNIAIWSNHLTKADLIGEFAFQMKFERLEELRRKPRELSEEFFRKLQIEAQEWIQLGTTKTALIYGLGRTPVVNHE